MVRTPLISISLKTAEFTIAPVVMMRPISKWFPSTLLKMFHLGKDFKFPDFIGQKSYELLIMR